MPVSEPFPLHSFLRWLWAFAAQLPSYCWLYLSLLFHFWSRMCPGHLLLWLLPLASHRSPHLCCCPHLSEAMFMKVIFSFRSSSCSFLPLLCPYQPSISHSQSLLGSFLYKFTFIIKVPSLFIFSTPHIYLIVLLKGTFKKNRKSWGHSPLLSLPPSLTWAFTSRVGTKLKIHFFSPAEIFCPVSARELPVFLLNLKWSFLFFIFMLSFF